MTIASSNKPLSILFLTYQGGLAGSTNSIAYLAIGLAERGHNIFVGIRPNCLLWDMLENTPVNRVAIPMKTKADLFSYWQVNQLVRKNRIQIINAQSSYDRYITIFSKWFLRYKAKIIHTRRQNPMSSVGWLQRQFYMKNTENIVVISEGLKRIFENKGYRSSHLKVIHNGIPKARYGEWSQEQVDQIRNKLNFAPGAKIVGSVSRIKEQQQIIQAVSEMNDPCIELVFAGLEREAIQPYIDQYELTNKVHVLGKVPAEEVLNVYRVLDVNILASTMDGFGLVLLEAMAMECPVIATNFGGIPDVVEDGVNGLLFENNDIDTLKTQILRLFNEKGLKEKFIENGKKTAFEKYTMEKTISKYEEYFRSLVDKNKSK